jgi:hypothetical protein
MVLDQRARFLHWVVRGICHNCKRATQFFQFAPTSYLTSIHGGTVIKRFSITLTCVLLSSAVVSMSAGNFRVKCDFLSIMAYAGCFWPEVFCKCGQTVPEGTLSTFAFASCWIFLQIVFSVIRQNLLLLVSYLVDRISLSHNANHRRQSPKKCLKLWSFNFSYLSQMIMFFRWLIVSCLLSLLAESKFWTKLIGSITVFRQSVRVIGSNTKQVWQKSAAFHRRTSKSVMCATLYFDWV